MNQNRVCSSIDEDDKKGFFKKKQIWIKINVIQKPSSITEVKHLELNQFSDG